MMIRHQGTRSGTALLLDFKLFFHSWNFIAWFPTWLGSPPAYLASLTLGNGIGYLSLRNRNWPARDQRTLRPGNGIGYPQLGAWGWQLAIEEWPQPETGISHLTSMPTVIPGGITVYNVWTGIHLYYQKN